MTNGDAVDRYRGYWYPKHVVILSSSTDLEARWYVQTELGSCLPNRAHLRSDSQVTSKPWAQADLGSGEETAQLLSHPARLMKLSKLREQ